MFLLGMKLESSEKIEGIMEAFLISYRSNPHPAAPSTEPD